MIREPKFCIAAAAFATVSLVLVSILLAEEDVSIRAERELSETYRESFAPPDDTNDKVQQELQDLIDKVNAMSLPEAAPSRRTPPTPQRPAPTAPTQDDNAAEPSADAPADSTDEQAPDAAGESDPGEDADDAFGAREAYTLPEPLLEKLTRQATDHMPAPQRLADALFASGNPEQAYAFYAKQLESAEDPEDQAWLLYQMGNCTSDSDRTAAAGHYRRVIAEFADSPWAPLAEANLELLTWMSENEPRKFLQDLQAELNSIDRNPSPATTQLSTTTP